MQFRTVSAKVKGGVRTYGQIVKSYRRPTDGKPTHKVIASLGEVTAAQAAAFKTALAAIRTGNAVQVVDAKALDDHGPVAQWSRKWLDVAACIQAWQDSGLEAMVRGLFADHEQDVHPADVVAALVVQRCVAPDSKLEACSWFPDTALPELLGIAPAKFHNTRVHRVLEQLEKVDANLQCALSDLMAKADGESCTALYIDCTDTWFTGRGPELAQRGKTKEEFYREKIGIVLLCRQDGMPLRFEVLRGNTEDGGAMLRLLGQMEGAAWLGAAPLVADRAVGNTADLLEMADLGLRYVTALVASEHRAYGAEFRCPALLDLDSSDPKALDRAGAAAETAGMTRHAPDLYVVERSVVQRDAAERATAQAELAGALKKGYRRGDDLTRDKLAQARRFQELVKSGKFESMEALKRGISRSNGYMDRITSLLRLPDDVQARIDAGEARHLTKRALEEVCKGRDHSAHRTAFDSAIAAARPKERNDRRVSAPPNDAGQPWVQIAIAFNPVMWRAKRQRAEERHLKLLGEVDTLNRRLRQSGSRLTAPLAQAQLRARLMEAKATKLYEIEILELNADEHLLHLKRGEDQWRKQRSRDGIQVIAAAPSIDLAAADRVRLYRSKDQIERDFKEIKSVLELRPIWHRTDKKVRAHVTLCVLALAVQRWLGRKLTKAGRSESTETALDQLDNVRLLGLLLPGASAPLVQPNGTTDDRRALAEALGVGWALTATGSAKHIKQVR